MEDGDTPDHRRRSISRMVQWESNARYDWAVVAHDGFRDREAPVGWVRHFLLLKGRGLIVVDQLESDGEHAYTWLFHLSPDHPVADPAAQSLFTGYTEKNLRLLPAAAAAVTGPEMTERTINRQGRNLPNPVARYTATGGTVAQAFLFWPVAGDRAPEVRFDQEVTGTPSY